MNPAHQNDLHIAAQSLRDLEALATSKRSHNDLLCGNSSDSPPGKVTKTHKQANSSNLRHVATEKKRRDRINEGFAALGSVLPCAEGMDKAKVLTSTVSYIKELQGALQEVLKSDALSHLDADQQWSLRMLLPRGRALVVKPAPAQTAPAPPAIVNMDGNATLQPAAAAAAAAPVQPLLGSDVMLALLTAALAGQATAAQVPKAPDANAHLTQLLLAAQMMQPQLCFPTTAMPQALAIPALTAPVVSMPPAGLQDPAQPAACCNSHQDFQVMPAPNLERLKARKTAKARRHTSASRISSSGMSIEAPIVSAGRPSPAEYIALTG